MQDPNIAPAIRLYAGKRLSDRAVDELIGICKGVLADGIVTQPEAAFLQNWMSSYVSNGQ